jgi:hypothetical protein
LTIRTSPNRHDSALCYIRHLLKLIGQGLTADVEQVGLSANAVLPWLCSGDTARNIAIGKLFCTKLPQSSSITNGHEFQALFQRTMRQLQRDSKAVIRLLIDGGFNTHPFNLAEFWNKLAVGLKDHARMINFRFVFVPPLQHLEGYKELALRPRSVPLWITQNMWFIEVAEKGDVDPAID